MGDVTDMTAEPIRPHEELTHYSVPVIYIVEDAHASNIKSALFYG